MNMKSKFFVLIASVCFISCIAQEKNSILKKESLTTKVDSLVKQYTDLDIFSGVVLIAEKGKPVYHKAFGLADREQNTANTINTKFDIGSMNKTFTKVVILQLLQEGRLKMNDKLGKYLDGFSDLAAQTITIEHLLNHSSGFGDYFSEDYFNLPSNKKTIAALVERIKKMPLLFKPGEEREYSNSGYILLGAIIERITGDSYYANVEERIIKPLELENTYINTKHDVPQRAIGYYKTMKGELLNNNGFMEKPKPDGGFQSTTLDILKFYKEFHYGTTILSEETKMNDEFYKLTQAHKTTGGAIPHFGGFEGANTAKYEILRDGITIIVFANMDEPVAEQLGPGILAIIRGKQPIKPSLPAIQNVYKAYNESGIDYVKNNFDNLITNFHPTDPEVIILNEIGYSFLQEKNQKAAIEIFELNTSLFPEEPNVWDSLGEAYLKSGNQEKALIYYKKALAIEPGFPSAQKMVKKLEHKG